MAKTLLAKRKAVGAKEQYLFQLTANQYMKHRLKVNAKVYEVTIARNETHAKLKFESLVRNTK